MELKDQIIKQDENLYFVKGFYEDYYLVHMTHRVREVKINKYLLEAMRISHDESKTIGDSVKLVLGESATNELENRMQGQIDLLRQKGMVQFI